MSNFYVMESCNLFVSDADPTNSKHLTIAELKLPDLTEIMADHHAGGARVAIEVEVGVEKLEPTFKLNGFDPLLLAEFGLGSRFRNNFTAYGVMRDQKTGKAIEAKAIMEGRLGKIAPDAHQRGELQGHEYSINSLIHYELWFNSKQLLMWDFFTNAWVINGQDENADENRILRIPNAG